MIALVEIYEEVKTAKRHVSLRSGGLQASGMSRGGLRGNGF